MGWVGFGIRNDPVEIIASAPTVTTTEPMLSIPMTQIQQQKQPQLHGLMQLSGAAAPKFLRSATSIHLPSIHATTSHGRAGRYIPNTPRNAARRSHVNEYKNPSDFGGSLFPVIAPRDATVKCNNSPRRHAAGTQRAPPAENPTGTVKSKIAGIRRIGMNVWKRDPVPYPLIA